MYKKIMYKKIMNKQGITPLGLIIMVALIGLVIVIGMNRFMPKVGEQILNIKERSLRLLMEKAVKQIDQIIEYSSNICAVPKVFVADTGNMDPNCNYIMVSPDGKRIVIMKHDGDKFIEKTVVMQEYKNVEYEMFFEKGPKSDVNNVIKYEIDVYMIDQKENTNKKKIVFESSVEPIGETEIIDKGTGIHGRDSKNASPSVALKYSKQ